MPIAMLQVVLLLALVAPTDAQSPKESGHAKLLRATWLEPGEAHTIDPHGTITTNERPMRIVTNIPQADDLKGDLTMTFVVEFDTTTGTKAPLLFTQRSSILTITPSPEDLKDDVIQPSAIDGTTAKVRVDVTAHGARLTGLKPVYFEQVKVWMPGQKKKQQVLEWTWKPYGKHVP